MEVRVSFLILAMLLAATQIAALNKVLVTGGAGRTGSLVFSKLLQRKDIFTGSALVRTKKLMLLKMQV